MIENFEERKIELQQQLQEKYAEKPRSWWRGKKVIYKSTFVVSNTNENYQPYLTGIIIKNNLSEAIIIIAFLLPLSLFFIKQQLDNKSSWFTGILFTLFLMVAFIVVLAKAFDRSPKLLIDKDGIWIKSMTGIIPWNCVVASYIKEEDGGEYSSYHFLLHYYNALEAAFTETTFPLSGLDMQWQEIAFNIEYWMMKTGNQLGSL